jgi:hypothetical protein
MGELLGAIATVVIIFGVPFIVDFIRFMKNYKD